MIRRLAALCIALAPAAPASAAPLIDQTDDPVRRTAIDGAHRQLATCAAFFVITAEGIPPTADNRPARQRLERAVDALIGQMLRLRAESVTRARIEAERQFLMLVMGGGLDGYPRLRETFADPCEAMAADPRAHVDRWLAGTEPTMPPGQ